MRTTDISFIKTICVAKDRGVEAYLAGMTVSCRWNVTRIGARKERQRCWGTTYNLPSMSRRTERFLISVEDETLWSHSGRACSTLAATRACALITMLVISINGSRPLDVVVYISRLQTSPLTFVSEFAASSLPSLMAAVNVGLYNETKLSTWSELEFPLT